MPSRTNAAACTAAGEGYLWGLCVAGVGPALSVIIGMRRPMPVLATTVAVVLGGACVPLISRRWR